jgi:hypothetical protein
MTDLEQVQIQIETAEKIRKLRDNCVKLMDNIYFKDVIEEAYFKIYIIHQFNTVIS